MMRPSRSLHETVYHPTGTIRLATPAELAAASAPPQPAAAPVADAEAVASTAANSALDTAEWSVALGSPEAVPALIEQHVQAAAALPAEDAAEHLHAALALANHALPDDHPRKITWGAVDALRSALVVYHDSVGSTFGPLGIRRHPWRAMAATTEILGSLLPPRAG